MGPDERVDRRLENAEREDEEVAILLGRVLELPAARQLEFHKVLSEVLGGSLGSETERATHVRRRLEALEAMRSAAKQLGLPDGQAPSVREFKQAARAARLPMSFTTIHKVFDGRWELASRYYQGLPVPRNAAQRAISREGGKHSPREDALLGLRMWLREMPSAAGRSPTSYRDWAVERNEQRLPGRRRVLEIPGSAASRLRLAWPYAVAVAAEEMTLDEARGRYLNELINGSGPLVGWEAVAHLLELPKRWRGATPPGCPNPVTFLHRKPHWLLADVRAYENGQRVFEPARHLEGRFMTAEEVGSVLDLNYEQTRARLRRPNPSLRYSPPPAGRSGRHNYWERETVERWVTREAQRREERMRDRVAYNRASPRRKAQNLT